MKETGQKVNQTEKKMGTHKESTATGIHILERTIGRYPEAVLENGPTLLVSGGVHGNEPSGILALQRAFEKLHRHQVFIKGQVIGVAGNMKALSEGVRLIDKDLNRICTPETADKIKNNGILDLAEEEEFKGLLEVVNQIEGKIGFQELYFMDFHTTSSPTHPYISVNKAERSFAFAQQFPLPVVRGIEKFIPGHFDHFLSLSGHCGFTVEAGQHESPLSVDYHEAMIYEALILCGMMEKSEFPEWEQYATKLETSSVNQGSFEVVYRHQLSAEDDFMMVPGFKNFDKVSKGQLLAWNKGEPVYSDWDDYIFMPLYQSQGSDGFFIVASCGQ
jgi:succinylglutamate desuccinylase